MLKDKRNYGKRLISLLLCLVLVLSMAACSPKETKTDDTNQTGQTADVNTTDTAGQEIVLTDQAGREVKLDAPAEKIVSCYYITTYACLALGLKDKLVGIESKADKRPIYGMAAPELLELPAVGTLKEFNVEAAAAVEPDLVIMPKKLQDSADALTELGIPVLVVYPETQELLEEMLTLIGKACGAEENAEELIEYYRDAEKELAGYAEETGVKVYMAGVSSYMNTAPEGMYQADVIQKAGGVNAAQDLTGDYWTEVSYEDILAMNPDVIIVPSSAEYNADELRNDPQLSEVNAVKNGAVYQMPKGIEEWDSPIPSGILGIRWLSSILHEDAYSMDAMKEDAKEFYETFYQFQLDESLITK